MALTLLHFIHEVTTCVCKATTHVILRDLTNYYWYKENLNQDKAVDLPPIEQRPAHFLESLPKEDEKHDHLDLNREEDIETAVIARHFEVLSNDIVKSVDINSDEISSNLRYRNDAEIYSNEGKIENVLEKSQNTLICQKDFKEILLVKSLTVMNEPQLPLRLENNNHSLLLEQDNSNLQSLPVNELGVGDFLENTSAFTNDLGYFSQTIVNGRDLKETSGLDEDINITKDNSLKGSHQNITESVTCADEPEPKDINSISLGSRSSSNSLQKTAMLDEFACENSKELSTNKSTTILDKEKSLSDSLQIDEQTHKEEIPVIGVCSDQFDLNSCTQLYFCTQIESQLSFVSNVDDDKSDCSSNSWKQRLLSEVVAKCSNEINNEDLNDSNETNNYLNANCDCFKTYSCLLDGVDSDEDIEGNLVPEEELRKVETGSVSDWLYSNSSAVDTALCLPSLSNLDNPGVEDRTLLLASGEPFNQDEIIGKLQIHLWLQNTEMFSGCGD